MPGVTPRWRSFQRPDDARLSSLPPCGGRQERPTLRPWARRPARHNSTQLRQPRLEISLRDKNVPKLGARHRQVATPTSRAKFCNLVL